MSESLTGKTWSGMLWNTVERFSLQGVQFIIGIIMARILSPTDFGMIGMLTIFLTVSQSLIDSGFSNALIQKRNRNEIDFSTIFYFNIFIGIIVYVILFLTAPYIAEFYKMPLLTDVTRVIAISLVISSFSAIHKTKLVIKVDFKTQTKASFLSSVISGFIGCYLAYSGFGVWALVYQTLINALVGTFLLYHFLKWKPLIVFSKQSFSNLFAFGSRLLVANLLNTVYRNLYTLVIGKKFSATELGYYTRADQLAQFIPNTFSNILLKVAFPILIPIQDDNLRLIRIYRKYIRMSVFLTFPLMMGGVALAKPLILTLLTEKWIDTVLLLQLLCIDCMFDPISSINLNLLYVKGRSDLVLRLEIIKKTIAVIILFLSLPWGLVGICCGRIIYSLIAVFINICYTDKLVHISFFMQVRDILPSLLLAISMSLVVYLCISIISYSVLKLILGIILGGVYYIVLAYLFKMKSFQDLIEVIKHR